MVKITITLENAERDKLERVVGLLQLAGVSDATQEALAKEALMNSIDAFIEMYDAVIAPNLPRRGTTSLIKDDGLN